MTASMQKPDDWSRSPVIGQLTMKKAGCMQSFQHQHANGKYEAKKSVVVFHCIRKVGVHSHCWCLHSLKQGKLLMLCASGMACNLSGSPGFSSLSARPILSLQCDSPPAEHVRSRRPLSACLARSRHHHECGAVYPSVYLGVPSSIADTLEQQIAIGLPCLCS